MHLTGVCLSILQEMTYSDRIHCCCFEVSLTQSCKCEGGRKEGRKEGRKTLGRQLVVTCWTWNYLFTRLGYSVFTCGGRDGNKTWRGYLPAGFIAVIQGA
jgi:hypothetical protein